MIKFIIYYCLLLHHHLLSFARASARNTNEDEADLQQLQHHLPRVLGVHNDNLIRSDDKNERRSLGDHGGRRDTRSRKGGKAGGNGCDITLYPNLNLAKNPTSIVTAEGNVYTVNDANLPFNEFTTGTRFLIPGNALYHNINQTIPAGKYIGSLTKLDNYTTTQDILTLVIDNDIPSSPFPNNIDAIDVAGFTIAGEPEFYIITGGSGLYAKRTGIMTIPDCEPGIPFCIMFDN